MKIQLVPLLPGEFTKWQEEHIQKYALERSQYGGGSLTEETKTAQGQMQKSLPQGIHTPHHYFFWIKEDDARVGEVWFQHRADEKVLYLYFIEIFSKFRRRGLSKLALEIVYEKAKDLGAGKVQLHVFAANLVARTLYAGQDFRETSVWMEKALDV